MSRNIRETPVLSRKRKGDSNYQFSGNLLLNPVVISTSPHLSRSRSIKSLNSETSKKSALKFKEKNDWTKQKHTDAASEEAHVIYRNTTGWASNLFKKVVNIVVDKFSKHEDESIHPELEQKKGEIKKRKTVVSHKESPLKSELQNSSFLPVSEPKENDIKFNKSPIEWELEKIVNDNTSKNNDYGTKFIRRHKYKGPNTESQYLKSVYKGTYKSPEPKDSSPPTPSSSTSENKFTSISKLIVAIKNELTEKTPLPVIKKDDDLIFLGSTPLRHSLKFDYTDLTFEKETSFYQDLLKQRKKIQEEAHKAKLKAQESTISSKDEERLKDIWKSRGKDQQKLITAFNIDVKVNDFKTLADGRWLNDVIIEVFLKTLDNEKVYAFNSYFYTTLEERGYTGVKKWLKRAKRDISKLDLIICPINVHGTHWVLGVINIKERKIIYMDSLANSKNSFSKRALEHLKEYIQGESEKQGFPQIGKDYELIHDVNCPQQRNGFDCGVFTLLNAKKMAEGKKLDYPNNYPTQFRKEIALKILSLSPKKSNL